MYITFNFQTSIYENKGPRQPPLLRVLCYSRVPAAVRFPLEPEKTCIPPYVADLHDETDKKI